jgi:hypothetical protein
MIANKIKDLYKMVYPLSISIKAPETTATVSEKQKRFFPQLLSINNSILQALYVSITNNSSGIKGKEGIANETAKVFAGININDFDEWITSLPEIAQKLLYDVVIYNYVPLEKYKSIKDDIVVTKDKPSYMRYYESYRKYAMNNKLNISFIEIDKQYGYYFFSINKYIREILHPWFELPDNCKLANAIYADVNTYDPWTNEDASETFPLLCEALQDFLKKNNGPGTMYKGFTKRQLEQFSKASGYKKFVGPFVKEISTIDLASRFILSMMEMRIECCDDPYECIKKLLHEFFIDENKRTPSFSRNNFLEITLVTDFMLQKPGGYLDRSNEIPASRKVLFSILQHAAKTGSIYDVDKLCAWIETRKNGFRFCDENYEEALCIKADAVKLDDMIVEPERGNNHITPPKYFWHGLLVKPLFRAYCCMLAALGLLEVSFADPPKPILLKGEYKPVSMFDALKTIKVTELGRWALGVGEKPEVQKSDAEAIADNELLLVTVRGKSLARRLFLDKIGDKLGDGRWKISPQSFIRECSDQEDIAKRIDSFKTLVCQNPGQHWQRLFDNVFARVGVFSQNVVNAAVFKLPADKALHEELFAEGELDGIAFRAEGGMLIVPQENQKTFLSVLASHGIVWCVKQ